MLKAAIFDFDGIIADTEPLHFRAFLDVLEPEGYSFSWEEYIERYIGFDDRDMFRAVFAERGKQLSPRHLSTLIGRKTERFMEAVEDGVEPYPGVVELIGRLGRHLPLALCSGALLCDIEPIMNRLGLFDLFAVVVSAEQVMASKPDPESYRLAVKRLQELYPDRDIAAANCVAIEDTPAGIASAVGAGIPTMAVTNSFPASVLSRADRVVTTLEGLGGEDFEAVTAG